MTYEEILQAMTEEFTELAGFSPDGASDIGIRMKVLAAQLYELWLKTERLQEEMFPQTAQGKYLDMHGETRGILRREAAPSVGKLVFSRQTPAGQDIAIPAGTVCAVSESPQLCFETTEEAVLKAGALSVTAPARSTEGGAEYNVAAGRIDVMVTPPQGISQVTNPAQFADGVDREGDESLRARVESSFRVISNGTNTAYYYDEAMKYEGVASANVLPRSRGRGTVDVIVQARPGVDAAALRARMAADFEKAKEINVDVQVLPPKTQAVACTVQAAVEDGHTFAAVEAQIKEAAAAFFAGIGVGAPLYRAALISTLYAVPGVANCRLTAPAEDMPQDGDGLFTLGSVTVTELILAE